MLGDLSVGSSTGVQTVNVTMAITPGAVAWTLEYVLLLGATSAIWPAWQAVRTPIIRALHDD
jgi:ABC-type lipoprotein release transport system permease subunit